jgi:hypothetical protein
MIPRLNEIAHSILALAFCEWCFHSCFLNPGILIGLVALDSMIYYVWDTYVIKIVYNLLL